MEKLLCNFAGTTRMQSIFFILWKKCGQEKGTEEDAMPKEIAKNKKKNLLCDIGLLLFLDRKFCNKFRKPGGLLLSKGYSIRLSINLSWLIENLPSLGWHTFAKSFQNPGTRHFSHSLGPKDFKKSKFSYIDGRLPMPPTDSNLWSRPQ